MTTDPTHLPVGPPLAPPPRSTAFDDYATTGDDQDAGDGAPRAASPLVLAVLGILLGLAAGIGVGYGIWGGSTTTTQSAGAATGQFPGAGASGANGQFPGGGGPGSGGRGFPFASGTVPSVSGNTIEVKTANGTTKVTISDSTKVTKSSGATSSDIVAGSCLSARGDTSSDGTVAATNVTVSAAAADGTCAAIGPGDGDGGFGGGVPPGPGTN